MSEAITVGGESGRRRCPLRPVGTTGGTSLCRYLSCAYRAEQRRTLDPERIQFDLQ